MKRSAIDHPKIARLCAVLNIPRYAAVGILELMWHFTAKRAPQGDIGKFTDAEIAEAVDWRVRSGSPGVATGVRLTSALVAAGFLDRSDVHRLVVHDWQDHADQQVTRTLAKLKLDFIYAKTSLPLPLPLPKPEPIYIPPLIGREKARAPAKSGDSEFADWFERQYARHPKKKNRVLAEQAAVGHYQSGKLILEEFEKVHIAWCASEEWRWKGGAKAPVLAEWIEDFGYRYQPESPTDEPHGAEPSKRIEADTPETERRDMENFKKRELEKIAQDYGKGKRDVSTEGIIQMEALIPELWARAKTQRATLEASK